MCGRYSISKKAREIGEHFSVTIPQNFNGAVYNAAPTQLLPVIAMNEAGNLQLMQWGLQSKWKNEAGNPSLVINARAESLQEKRIFSGLLETKRCLIPADGFFEWQKAGKSKQPWRFTLINEGLFAFAGIFDAIGSRDGEILWGFSIITTRANDLLSGIHDRMPVILDLEGSKTWISQKQFSDLEELLVPYPTQKMKSYKVSPKVNSAAANSPDLIVPWQDPNLTLF